MKNLSKLILVFASLFIVLILNPETAKAQEMEDQKEFDYIVGSDKSPDKWGDLHEEWADCKNGNFQSPIDLLYQKMEVAPYLGEIWRTYGASPATLANRGHAIAIEWRIGGAGSVLINGDRYELQQYHWHSPSEHHINGRKFALELHMVHHNQQLNRSDESVQELINHEVSMWSQKRANIVYKHRFNRTGYKAGNLKSAMACDHVKDYEFVAIFDADFQPTANFLKKTIPHFEGNPEVGLIQARWSFVNQDENLFTRLQKINLCFHFEVEQQVNGAFLNFFGFNGTAGVWRIKALEES